jgi:hypothetical protein
MSCSRKTDEPGKYHECSDFGEFARAVVRKNCLAIEMSTADLMHRLRLREHQARDRHDHGLAEDLRHTIETLRRLERERLFVRPLVIAMSSASSAAEMSKRGRKA